MLNEDFALIEIEDVEEIEDVVFEKIITDDSDEKKLGRIILADISFTHIGISQLNSSEEGDDKPIVIIFSKNIEKDKIEENISESSSMPKEDQNQQENIYSDVSKKVIVNLDNNVNKKNCDNSEIDNSVFEEDKEGPKVSMKKI